MRSAPTWKTLFNHYFPIVLPLFFQYWSQTWDKYHIDLNHCFHWFHWIHWFHWFHWFQPPKPSITTTTLELFLNYFWTFQKTPASAFLKIQIRIFFELLSPSHKPSSPLSYIYFQTLILRRLTHLPLWYKHKNHKI